MEECMDGLTYYKSYGFMSIWIDVCICGWLINRCLDGWVDGWMDEYLDGWMNGYYIVFINIY